MNIIEALQVVADYLETREKERGERHPSLPSLKAFILEEQENAGLENKTKADLIKLVKEQRRIMGGGSVKNPLTISPETMEAGRDK